MINEVTQRPLARVSRHFTYSMTRKAVKGWTMSVLITLGSKI